jgi:hypothetical protein
LTDVRYEVIPDVHEICVFIRHVFEDILGEVSLTKVQKVLDGLVAEHLHDLSEFLLG